jgi:hypoxanthine phosphoribosyltransferase
MSDRDHIEDARMRAEVVHDAEAVEAAISEMGQEITRELADSEPVVLAVLLGGLIPTARLLEHLRFPYQLDYLHATRYRGTTEGGKLHWLVEARTSVAGRTVLVIDDILDEGVTLKAIQEHLEAAGAAKVYTAVLAVKDHGRRVAGVSVDFEGLVVPDRYVFGCGMDYMEYHRGLPEILALPQEESE